MKKNKNAKKVRHKEKKDGNDDVRRPPRPPPLRCLLRSPLLPARENAVFNCTEKRKEQTRGAEDIFYACILA